MFTPRTIRQMTVCLLLESDPRRDRAGRRPIRASDDHDPQHRRRARLDSTLHAQWVQRDAGRRGQPLRPLAARRGLRSRHDAAPQRRGQLDRPGDLHLVRGRADGGTDEYDGLRRHRDRQPRIRLRAGRAGRAHCRQRVSLPGGQHPRRCDRRTGRLCLALRDRRGQRRAGRDRRAGDDGHRHHDQPGQHRRPDLRPLRGDAARGRAANARGRRAGDRRA